jgi:hypothetical protein
MSVIGTNTSVNLPTFPLEPEEPPMVFGTCPGRSRVGTGPGLVLPKSYARLTSPVYGTCTRNTFASTLLNEFVLVTSAA